MLADLKKKQNAGKKKDYVMRAPRRDKTGTVIAGKPRTRKDMNKTTVESSTCKYSHSLIMLHIKCICPAKSKPDMSIELMSVMPTAAIGYMCTC